LTELKHHSSGSETNGFSILEKENTSNVNLRNAINFQSFRNKRKLITEEDITKRAIIRLKRKEKEERYQANFDRSNAIK